ATFGAGFLMRPLGAIFLGAYVDHRGRRAGLLVTLGLMAIGTLSIACTPGYAVIGLLAPLLVLLGRLLQGLSAGVELGGVSVYLLEIAPPDRRGFFVSWQSATQQLAVVFAALLGLILTANVSPTSMTRWGWRIPLLTGCLMIPFLLQLRRSLEETDDFRSRSHHPTMSSVIRTLGTEWRLVGLGMLLATMVTVSFYLITAYTPTFGSAVLHLTSKASLAVTLCVGVSNFVWVPVAGALSDRIGRRALLFACTILTLLTAYPALLWLVSAPSFFRLLAVELWLSMMFGGYSGALVVFMTEMMPVPVRTAAFSLAFTLATAIFGGFTPAACTYLIHATGNRAMPGVWLSAAAACGLFAAVRLSPARLAPKRAATTA
ncbi:MAG TPA: tricarballylate/proton symporter TcuC, partial [Bryobacteraceae bacterium]